MPKHPKPTAEPSTAPTRLTPQEIDALRGSPNEVEQIVVDTAGPGCAT
jgi:hypothetical protein